MNLEAGYRYKCNVLITQKLITVTETNLHIRTQRKHFFRLHLISLLVQKAKCVIHTIQNAKAAKLSLTVKKKKIKREHKTQEKASTCIKN